MMAPLHDLPGLREKSPRQLAEFHMDAAALLIRCPRAAITADVRVNLAVEHLEAAVELQGRTA